MPTPSAGPKCATLTPEPASYSLVGWRAGRLVVVAMTFPACGSHYLLLSADPAVGSWRSEMVFDEGMPLEATTDGRTVAFPFDDRVVVIEPSGATHSIARPADVGVDWDAYGLPSLPDGGYLVVGVDRLLRITSDGSGMTSDPLPLGYVAVAPTSNPDRFIITPTGDTQVPYGLGRAPFRGFLWDRTTGSLHLLQRGVTRVLPAASKTGLAFLASSGKDVATWSLVTLNGGTVPFATTAPSAWLAPDGRLAVVSQSPDLPSSQTVILDPRTGHTIADISPLWASGTAWAGDRAAVLVQPRPPAAGQAAVFVVAGSSAIPVELP